MPRLSATERVLAAAVHESCPDPAWRIEQQGYHRDHELQVESRFAVSNGALGVRGSLEIPTDISSPRTYVAGLYDLSSTGPAVPALAFAPDWLRIGLEVEDEVVDLDGDGLIALTRTLDLRHGVFWCDLQYRTRGGHVVHVRTLRFVSLVERSLAVQAARIDVVPARGTKPHIVLEAEIAPAPSGLAPERIGEAIGTWKTLHEGQRLAMAWAPRLEIGGRRRRPMQVQSTCAMARRWEWDAVAGRAASLIRPVAIVAEREEQDPAQTATEIIRHTERRGFRRILDGHRRAWEARWQESDVEVAGDVPAQEGLRFAIYHLIGAANPEDDRSSIGARALTGDSYAGRVFWDTEIYLLPFYIATHPTAARAALMYRYHTLSAARGKAQRMGYRGAFYAWESARTGEEATPPFVFDNRHEPIYIKNGTQELHISADVAYAAWQYWQTTGDDGFLRDAGAEIILETARFWASRARCGPDGKYHIAEVIGPDEYHDSVDDNAYTNGMAQWNLQCGVAVAELLASRWSDDWAHLLARTAITPHELETWRDIAAHLEIGPDPASGVIEQFRGYFKLEPITVASYMPRTVPMDVILGPERTRRSQVTKQPDVLMLFALLPHRYPHHVQRASFDYYLARCGHGSSLSPSIHALVAARLGKQLDAECFFAEAMAIDLDDTMGNAAGGVHIGALGGLWQAAVFGFAGVRSGARGLEINPRLPRTWQGLRFPIQWRGRRARIAFDSAMETVAVTLEVGGPLPVQVGHVDHILKHGETWTIAWPSAADGGLEQAA
jgi:kojibiose phosphorylase